MGAARDSARTAARRRSARRASSTASPTTRCAALFHERARERTTARSPTDVRTLAHETLAPRARALSAETRADSRRAVARLRKRLAEIGEIDFFGAPGREAAEGLLGGLEQRSRRPAAERPRGRERTHAIADVQRPDLGHAQGRPHRPHRERLADPALHRPEARFKFVPARGYRPEPRRAALRHVRGGVHPRRRPLHVRGAARATSALDDPALRRDRRDRPRHRPQGREVRPRRRRRASTTWSPASPWRHADDEARLAQRRGRLRRALRATSSGARARARTDDARPRIAADRRARAVHAARARRATSCGSAPSASAARSRSSATCSATSSRRGAGSRSKDYNEGLALAQLAPGPLAAQLAIYLGWVRAGVARRDARRGRVRAAVVPDGARRSRRSTSRYGGLAWMQGAFYGIGAAVIAIIARSAYKLAQIDARAATALLWALFVVSARRHGVDRVRDRLALRALRRRRAASRSAAAAGARGARRSCPGRGSSPASHGPAAPDDALAASPGTSPRRARSSSAAGSRSCRSCTAAS